ncbi:MAG: hypothetical protein JNJ60_23010 [Rhodocyclaceae bacterium]|nr:hypothetical protein [Rhodocyclaceae bacterium]
MRDNLEKRLAELREEYASGTQVLAELRKKQDEVQATLLRISGAIQVLEELLGDTQGGGG